MSQPQLNRLGRRVYWLPPDDTTDRPILGVVAGQQTSLIIDAGNSPAHANLLLQQLAAANLPPPAFLMLTHWHWDHVFGASAFNLPILAHTQTKRIVAEMAHLDWSDQALDRRVEQGIEIEFCRDMIKAELPDRSRLVIKPPNVGFATQLELDLGGLTCHIAHVGGDHAADSSIVYVPEEKIMFLGDCFYPDLYHGPPNYTTHNLFPLLDRLLSYETDFYLLAHHPEPMSRQEMLKEAALLKQVGRLVERAGPQREVILAELAQAIEGPLTEEHFEMVDEFIAGLNKSTIANRAP